MKTTWTFEAQTSRPGSWPAGWIAPLTLACSLAAGALWYVRPQLGPWPLALVIVPWALRLGLAGQRPRRTPFDLPLALFLATAGMGVWAAFDRQGAWGKFWLIVAAAAIYYALAHLRSPAGIETFGRLYALFGAGLACYFFWSNNWILSPSKLAAFNRLGPQIQALLPAFHGHALQPNVMGGLLAMLVPFQVALLVGRPGSGGRRQLAWQALLGLTLAATGLALFVTTSRGAWVALAAGLGLWGLWQVAGLVSRGFTGRVVRLAGLLAAIALLALLLPRGLPALLGALPGREVLTDRAAIRERAVDLALDTPFTGAGLKSFPLVDAAYANPVARWAMFGADVYVPNAHAHNLWLNVAIEQGLPGLAALLWFLAVFAVSAWRGLRASSQAGADPAQSRLVQAALVSMGVVLVHALVDDALYGSRAVLLLFIPAGLLVALASQAPDGKLRSSRAAEPVRVEPAPAGARTTGAAAAALTAGAVLVLAVAAVAWHRPLAAALQANLGAVAQARAELPGYRAPDWNPEQARRAADLSAARAWFEDALALEPDQPTATLRLGMICLAAGDDERAVLLLERAYQARPDLQAARQYLAQAYLATGRLPDAAGLWAGVNEADLKLWNIWLGYRQAGLSGPAADLQTMVAQISAVQGAAGTREPAGDAARLLQQIRAEK